MFEVTTTFLNQLISLMPGLIALYILFDFIGSLLFGKR